MAVPESFVTIVDSLMVVANEAEFFDATTATPTAADCSFSCEFNCRGLVLGGLRFKRRLLAAAQVRSSSRYAHLSDDFQLLWYIQLTFFLVLRYFPPHLFFSLWMPKHSRSATHAACASAKSSQAAEGQCLNELLSRYPSRYVQQGSVGEHGRSNRYDHISCVSQLL